MQAVSLHYTKQNNMKRTYTTPTIEVIKLDNEISLILCSKHEDKDHDHNGHDFIEEENYNENPY